MASTQRSQKVLPADLYELTAEDTTRFAEERALGIAAPQAPLLSQVMPPVDPEKIGSPEIQAVIERLMQIGKGQQQSNLRDRRKRTLAGLAAPQIGERRRIFIMDTKIKPDRKKPGKLECFINPEIIWRSRETEEGREGCYSAGPVWGLVRRPIAVKFRALTPDGKVVERLFEGFTARVFLHEYDHLEGIRFPDRITSDRKRHWVHSEEIQLYVKKIRNWPRTCSRERWQQFKIEA